MRARHPSVRRHHVVTVPVHNIYIGSVNLAPNTSRLGLTLRGYILEITQTGFGLGVNDGNRTNTNFSYGNVRQELVSDFATR